MSDFFPDKFKLKVMFMDDPILSADIVEVSVDMNIFLPAMFMIVIQDTPDPLLGIMKYSDLDPRFQIGTPVTVGFETTDKNTGVVPISNTLVEGEITSIEPLFEDGRAQLRIRGYDRTHRLMRSKKTRAFQKVDESMIFSKIASETGMSPVPAGLPTFLNDYVMQYNQSNWDFLTERSRLYGYQFYADGKKLIASKFETPRGFMPVQLSLNSNLKRFEPRLVSSGQVTVTTVNGWDPDMKKAVSFKTMIGKSKTKIGDVIPGTAAVLKSFGKAEEVILSEKAIRSMSEASAIAKAQFAESLTQYIKASGDVIPGEPNLIAGSMAVVTGAGTRFSGTYYVTEARHVWRSGEYSVHFEVSGINPHTIRDLLEDKGSSHEKKINGVVVAKVTNINDPEKLGRIKVSYPWMPNNMSEIESDWARVASPNAGQNRGFFFTPEVNDEVLVAFEQGDMNAPFIVGCLWNKMDRPPKASGQPVGADGKNNHRIISSRSGHVVILDDTSGQEQIIIQDKTTKNSITIDSAKNAMTITSQGDLTLEAGGKLIIKSKGDFSIKSEAATGTIEATTSTKIKTGTSEIDLAASGTAIKGTTVDVKGNGQVSVQSTGIVQVQGSLVKIN